MSERGISRRATLTGLGMLVSAAFSGRSHANASANSRASTDLRKSAEGQIKMTATLDESPAFWSYEGLIYAVRAHERPRAILAVSGCQSQWAQRQSDGSYRLGAALLTFFRDPDSGAYLERWDNPYTGKRNEVKPNIFAGGGHAIYPADGGGMRIGGQIAASESAPQGFKPADARAAVGRVTWTQSAELVTLSTDQAFDVKAQPQLESQTRTAARSAFSDPRVKRLPARFSATTVSPWLAWLAMADTEGHLVWHTAGEKHFDLKSLPDHYLHRAGPLVGQLAARPPI